MIDAERILGSLVSRAMTGGRRRRRRRTGSRLGRGVKGQLALGALGVAFGVFEHLTRTQGAFTAAGLAGSSVDPAPSLPPLPGSGGPALPPLPGSAESELPPLPGGSAPASAVAARGKSTEALLLVRAMIAAANADHEVDDDERGRILRALEDSGLGDEETRFVLTELESPLTPAALAALAGTPELAGQVYLASLVAIEVDSPAEEAYLALLARELGLDDARVAELRGLLAEG